MSLHHATSNEVRDCPNCGCKQCVTFEVEWCDDYGIPEGYGEGWFCSECEHVPEWNAPAAETFPNAQM